MDRLEFGVVASVPELAKSTEQYVARYGRNLGILWLDDIVICFCQRKPFASIDGIVGRSE